MARNTPPTATLTEADVARLMTDPTAQTRVELATKVSQQFQSSRLSDNERRIAEEILHTMARDAVVSVRQALSENLKHASNLPRDLALTLARDVELVAVPLVQATKSLTEEDLLELVRGGSEAKQVAVARRDRVPVRVADAIAEIGVEKAVAALVANPGADLQEASLNRVLDRFGTSTLVQEPMAHRAKLPLTVAERLVALVSEELQDYLVSHHELPQSLASDLILKSRERATAQLFTQGDSLAEIERLVLQLAHSGRLTPSLVVRTLCMGDIPFFEVAMAQLARIPLENARILIHDGGPLGLKSLYERARMPGALFPAVRAGVGVAQETHYDGGDHDRERHRRRTIERLLTQYEVLNQDDADYLFSKLGDLMRTAA